MAGKGQLFFCEDFVTAILVSVPGKSLMRFKCVCKHWNLLISDSNFTKTHLKTSALIKRRNHMDFFSFIRYEATLGAHFSKLRIDDNFQGSSNIEVEETKSPLDSWSTIRCAMHCDGLLCIFPWNKWMVDKNAVLVWNPLTKEHKTFPLPNPDIVCWKAFGFGYDSSIDDYKVVYVMGCICETPNQYKIQSLRLKKGSWDNADSDISGWIQIHRVYSIGELVNGCLYWIAKKLVKFGGESSENVIVYFDLEKNILRELETSPPCYLLTGSGYHSLGNLEGSLCLGMSCSSGEMFHEIWVMREDEVTGTKSWNNLIKINLCSDENLITPSTCFTTSGKFITMTRDCMYLNNSKDDSVQKIRVNKENYDQNYWIYVIQYEESLISPNRVQLSI